VIDGIAGRCTVTAGAARATVDAPTTGAHAVTVTLAWPLGRMDSQKSD